MYAGTVFDALSSPGFAKWGTAQAGDMIFELKTDNNSYKHNSIIFVLKVAKQEILETFWLFIEHSGI